MPKLKAKSYGHLSDARVYGRAADDAERWRREISVRVRKLRMVESIEELSAKFNCAFFVWPRERNCFRNCHVQVGLARTINNSSSAVPESRSHTVRANHRRICETRSIKVVA